MPNAYIVIVPKPILNRAGIKRYGDNQSGDGRGQYMFWIKIGDSATPKTRVKKYTNHSQFVHLLSVTGAPTDKPGKDVEKMALKGYGDTGTEWHALFAENHDAALVLNEQLFILMTELEVADTHEYHILGGFLRKVVLQNCYQGFDGRGISNGRELKEEAKQIFAVYVLITPGLHGDNRGITGTRGTIRFSITIKAAKTQKSTAYEFAAERFQSHIPSFSYNGFRVKNAKEQRRAVKKMREYFEMVLQDMKDTDAEHYGTQHEIECAIDDDDRYWVKGKDLDRTLLREYVDWFDEGPIDLLAYNRPANPNPLSLRSWKPVSLEENMKKQQIEEEGEEAEEAEVGEVDDWDNMFDEA